MPVRQIKNVAVLGGGLMGSGIAQLAAQFGYNSVCREINKELADKAMASVKKVLDDRLARNRITQEEYDGTLSRFRVTDSLEDAVKNADIVIEAVPENIELKQRVFRDVEPLVGDDVILASNTSAISITEIAGCLKVKDRMIGTHFFQPAPVMRLVEVSRTPVNTDEVVEATIALVRGLNKVPVVVRDAPGFLSIRPSGGFHELAGILEEGVADMVEVDKILVARGDPMGPFVLLDFMGIDTIVSIFDYMYSKFGMDYLVPPLLLRQKQQLGHLGRKAKIGFYNYAQPPAKPEPPTIDKAAIQGIKTVLVLDNDASSPIAAAFREANYEVIVGKESDLAAGAARADAIFENLSNSIAEKQRILAQIDAAAKPTAIVGICTSAKSITEISMNSARRDRVIGTHFIVPVSRTRIMEVPATIWTSDATKTTMVNLLRDAGRDPVVIKDSPGFVQTRADLVHFHQAMSAVQANQASAWDVDAMAIYGHNKPKGPLQEIDEQGLDVVLDNMEYMYSRYGRPYFFPPQILRQKVLEGKLGKKTGEGFFDWRDGGPRW